MSQHVNIDQQNSDSLNTTHVDSRDLFFSLNGAVLARSEICREDFLRNASTPPTHRRIDEDNRIPVYNFEVRGTHTYIADGVRVHNDSTLSFVTEENGDVVGGTVASDGEITVITRSSDGGTWVITRSGFDPVEGTTSVTKEYSYSSDRGEGLDPFVLVQTETWGEDANGDPVYLGVEIDTINLAGDELGDTNLASGLTPYLSSAVGLTGDVENLFGGSVIETVLQNLIQISGNVVHHSFLDPTTNGYAIGEIAEVALEDFGAELTTNVTENAISLVSQLVMAEIYEVVDLGDGVVGDVAGALLTQGVNQFLSFGVSEVLEVEGIFNADEAYEFFTNPTALIATTLFNEVVPANSTVEGSIANLVSTSFVQAFVSPSAFSSLLPFAGLGPIVGPLVIGAAVGAVVDLVVDAIKNPEAYIDIVYDAQTGQFVLTNLRSDDGGVKEIAEQLGGSTHTYLSHFVEALAANSHNYAAISATSIGYKETNYVDGAGIRRGLSDQDASTDTVFGTLLEVLKQIRVADGDLKIKKILDLENFDTNTAGMTAEEAFTYLYSRMRIAQDYQYYLENTDEVNASLMSGSGSSDAAGWLATILQAHEMGLTDSLNATGDALDNVFYAGDGDDIIDGGDGNDAIKTYGGVDTLIGGLGDDYLEGGAGGDTIDGGLGQDKVGFAASTLGVGLDLGLGIGLSGDAEGDTYTSIEDVSGSDHADFILGSSGVNVIDGGAGDDFIDGRAGQDQLFGKEGDDFFIWGGGEDAFDGGLGVDTVSLEEVQTSITVQLSETDSPTITFTDGTIYSSFIDIESVRGSSANDTYLGDGGINWLEGGLGDDFLNGAEGSDTYVYNLGDGNDTISETDWDLTPETDIIKFGENITLGDVSASRNGADLILTIAGTGETITIVDQHVHHSNAATPHQIEEFHFVDGTIVDAEHWREFDIQSQMTTGNDTVVGFTFNDTLAGGAGDDRLEGGGGSDIYLVNLGEGNDTIREASPTGVGINNGDDTVKFGAGLLVSDVTLDRIGSDLVFNFAGGDSLTIEDQLSHSWLYVVDYFEFADGTVWSEDQVSLLLLDALSTPGDDLVRAYSWSNDTLGGGAGNDRLEGSGGSDTYLFNLGDGNDVIFDGAVTGVGIDNGADTVLFGAGLEIADLSVRKQGDDLQFIFVSGDSITVEDTLRHAWLYRVDYYEFADGTIWTHDDAILASLAPTDGDDIIEAYGSDDALSGGLGNDTLIGLSGSDTYSYAFGDQNLTIDDRDNSSSSSDVLSIAGGLVATDLVIEKVFDDLVITAPDGGVITIIDQFRDDANWGIESITFDDGSSLMAADILALVTVVYVPSLVGTSGNDLIEGTSGEDIIESGLGSDVVHGRDGSDTYIFNAGDGVDEIEDNGNRDTDILVIKGYSPSDVILTRQTATGDDLIITFSGSSDQIMVWNTLHGSSGDQIEEIHFDDGTIWTMGDVRAQLVTQQQTTGNDIINGFVYDDTIDAGVGDDVIHGGDGSDSYIFNAGDGVDEIEDNGNRDTDKLFINGHLPADVTLTRMTATGDDLLITFAGSTDQITIWNTLHGSSGDQIEEVHFDDGTVWNMNDVRANLVLQQQTTGNDTIEGFVYDETIEGGLGDDIVHGGDGSDSYIFNAGDGVDEIEDNGNRDTDKLFINGYAPADVTLTRTTTTGDDLLITFAGSTDQITIWNTLHGSSGDQIEEIHFDDGTVWNMNDVRAQLIVQQQTTGNDTIEGFVYDETIEAGLGDDVVHGGDGSDSYIFNSGDGIDEIEDNGNRDTDKLFINGHLPADTILTRMTATGDDLVITFNGSSDLITVWNTLNGSSGDQIEEIHFDDGTIWSMGDVRALLVAQQQTSGNDTIEGFVYNETIEGGPGDDIMHGGDGSDIYVFNAGDGIDEIEDNGNRDTDELHIRGVAVADVIMNRASAGSDDLIITFIGSSDQMTVWNTLNGSSNDQIERIVFDDGTVWDATEIRNQADTNPYSTVNGTAGDDVLTGSVDADVLNGLAGDDELRDSDGLDILHGGAGYDTAVFYSADRADYTFVEQTNGYVIATNTSTGGTDTLIDVEAVWFDQNSEWFAIEDLTVAAANFNLIDGTSGDETLIGTTGADFISGLGGDDELRGLEGDDRLDGGLGYDTVVIYNAAPADYTFIDQLNGEIVATNIATSEADTLIGIEAIWFDQTSEWFAIESLATPASGPNVVDGTTGDDILVGTVNADLLNGLEGDDELRDSDGADTLEGGAGYDTAVFYNAAPADYTFVEQSNGDVTATNTITSETDTLIGIEAVWFDQTSEWFAIGDLTGGSLPPIVLDMDGDGAYFRDQSISFDFDTDMQVEVGAWVDQGDAILALDRNGDGQISNGAEISFVDDLPGARTDLEGLAAFDTNDDGLFTASDERFFEFLLWTDANGDGVSQDGELISVGDAGLMALSLSSSAYVGPQPNENATIFGETVAVFSDGRSVSVADAALDFSEAGEQTLQTNSLDARIEVITAHFDAMFAETRGYFSTSDPYGFGWGYQRPYEFVERDGSLFTDLLEAWMQQDAIELPDSSGHILSTVKHSAEEIEEASLNIDEDGLVGTWLLEDKIDLGAIADNGFHTIKLSPDEEWYSNGKEIQYDVQSVENDREGDAPIPMHVAPEYLTDELWAEIA